MTWIEPLELQTWFISVLAGTPEIFTILGFFFIAGMAGFLRMNALATFFMVGLFLLLFVGFVNSSLMVLMAILGGLIIGFILSKVFTN